MKTAITIVMTLALATMYGCQSSSPQGGSVLKGEGFRIAVPTFSTEVKQGEVQSVTISLERGKYFKQDVKLQIEASKGISPDPTSILIKSSDRPEEQIQITVARDAALGEYSIRVMGIPETGDPTSTLFKVKVVSPCGCLSAGSV